MGEYTQFVGDGDWQIAWRVPNEPFGSMLQAMVHQSLRPSVNLWPMVSDGQDAAVGGEREEVAVLRRQGCPPEATPRGFNQRRRPRGETR